MSKNLQKKKKSVGKKKMSFKIVVAHYQESIDWLRAIETDCIFYNKASKLEGVHNQHTLTNIGRESHTYLHYIIENYDSLPDVVVFTQARISDHRHDSSFHHLLRLKQEALENGKSRPATHLIKLEEPSCWDPDWNKKPSDDVFFLEDCYRNQEPKVFRDWFLANIRPQYPDPIKIYPNAIFAVDRKHIRMRSKTFYQNLMKEVSHHVNPAEGHFMERSWYYIFS